MKPLIEPRIVMCIPGPWADRDELSWQIAKQSGVYALNGGMLQNTQTNVSFALQVEPADPRMSAAFGAVGPQWAETEQMEKIGSHAQVVYLTGQGGSRSHAEAMMHAAAMLVKAGGLGVKLDSSGIAHSPDAWLALSKERHLFSAHAAFVAYVIGQDIVSCGMHSLGLRDAAIAENDVDLIDDQVELLRIFTWYLFTENPVIRSGQTFSADEGEPAYRVTEEECTHYEPGELFHNPYGMWRLTRIAE